MRIKQAALATSVAVMALAGPAVIAAGSARTNTPTPQYDVEIPADASPAQRDAVEAMLNDSPIPVIDHDGKPHGFVRDADLTARDDRVTQKMIQGFREPKGPVDAEYNRLYEALRVLDPVPVVNEEGQIVGYWTHAFMSLEEHNKATAEAHTTVDRLLTR